ncbi:MAG: SpoIIE family protein phosphatase [Magnetococcales bacterium]|nr:SpoIIE family protein phosphatase [Magnetococcales bacterium]
MRDPNHEPVILVVDDTPENIDVLREALSANYQVRPAIKGQIALKVVKIQPMPDLILLDIMMPEMDGYEVCRRLQNDPVTRDIPVIFVTAKAEVDDEITGLTLGAVDYITKPFSTPIVQARVKTHLALRAAKLKLDEQNRLLQQEKEIIEGIVLKMRHADTFDTRHLQHLTCPVDMTAGDMLLATFTPDARQLVLLGDFTGHGLPAAIGSPLVTYIFHKLARNNVSGAEILNEINDQLCLRLPTGIFFAVTLLEISPERTQATLWNAGLPDVIMVRQGSVLSHFPSLLPPLGISRQLDIASGAVGIPLAGEDCLYVFSDGVIEARNSQDDVFGMDNLESFLVGVAQGRHTLHDLLVRLNDHVGSSSHEDDITIIEARV